MERSAISNYEVTRNSMEKKFLEYDQQQMIDKFGLKNTKEYLFMNFIGQECRISRIGGKVEYYSNEENSWVHADYNVSMTIFDVLCYSKPDCRLSGQFVSLNALKGLVVASAPGPDMFAKNAACFSGRCSQLQDACVKLGGTPEKVGDVSYKIPLFDFMDVILQFWDGDKEFAPVLRVLWDENILDYMHYETTFYATSHLFERLQKLAGV